LLNQINSPADLKKIPQAQLPQLAGEIREEIIRVIGRSGGHIASSLGAVEIIVGIHYVFDAPRDTICFDVGHQAYAHKILTGRRDVFKKIRTPEGISGFPNIKESPYDAFTVGHGSTSISTALGVAAARDLQGERHKVVAVIGDGSLGGGMAFEALNHAGHVKKDLIVVLNDNKMSIAESVGAISRYLNKVWTNPAYNKMRSDFEALSKRLPRYGFRVLRAARRFEEGFKNLVVPGMIFEEMGFRYFGPVDGHNVAAVIEMLKKIKDLPGPILVHVITQKGKGYSIAERLPEKFHGVSPFDIETGLSKVQDEVLAKEEEESICKKGPSCTSVFSEALVGIARENARVAAITAAMPEGTGLDLFAREFPERFFNVGMAEEHAVGFAAGLAKGGIIPVVAIYSTFLQRSYDQIIHDVCLQGFHVVFALDRAGLVGEDGPTHHGTFDIAYLRSIPGMTVMAPKNARELSDMLAYAVNECKGPVAIRYPRGCLFEVDYRIGPSIIETGAPELLVEGKELMVVALGSAVAPAWEAVMELREEENLDVGLMNARFAKPLGGKLLPRLAHTTARFVTVEESSRPGGFGSAVAELFEAHNLGVPLRCVALPDAFIAHGPRSALLAQCGLDKDSLKETIKEFIALPLG